MAAIRDGGERFACRASNLSVAGCYVETDHALTNPRLSLLLRVPGQHHEIACQAEVLRQDWKRDGKLGLALRFLSVDWTVLLGLARLVAPQLE
jgi:hypothetical protein